jgi:ribosome-associated protein
LNKKKINFLVLARAAAKNADDKKGEEINILSIKKYSSLAEYFLLITANSYPQIRAISEHIKKSIKEDFDLLPIHKEGTYSDSWGVLDYGGLLIHVMSLKARKFYRLDNLWENARHISFKK